MIDAVGEMELDAFYVAHRLDGRSRPAYDPAVMVALLLYAYTRGTRSSRQIERGCEEDVAFRVLAAQQRPDHATIARFVERHQDAIAGLFGEVCRCARRGVGVVVGLWANTMEGRPARWWSVLTVRDGQVTALADYARQRDAVRTLPPKVEAAP